MAVRLNPYERGRLGDWKLRHSCNMLWRGWGLPPSFAGTGRAFRLSQAIPGATEQRQRRPSLAARSLAFLCLGLLAGGCMQSTLEPASDVSMTPRDKKLLAEAPYAPATIPEPYRRHIVT